MGSSCSSAQKKKDKDRHKGDDGQSPIGDDRRRSTESIPYGKGSPPGSRHASLDRNNATETLPEESVESPLVAKTPVNAALSQASTVGEGSSSSPPPSATTGTPLSKDAPSLDAAGLPNLQHLEESTRGLVLGRLSADITPLPLQEILLYVSADFYDSGKERDALAQRVFPGLRQYAAEKGYGLIVTDLHAGVPGVEIIDHSLRDLCLDTLNEWKSKRRIMTMVVFNDNIGVKLLPRTLPKPHYEAALEGMPSDSDRDLFNKWYSLDENLSPPLHVLRPVTDHLPDVTADNVQFKREALTEWKEEASQMIELLKKVLPEPQKNKYLTSVLEDEIKSLVTDEPQESKRTLWVQRRFTHTKPSDGPNPDSRRIDHAKVQLEDYLPDTQKLVFYVKWHEGHIDPSTNEEDDRYIKEFCKSVKDELARMIDGILEEDFLEDAQRSYAGFESSLYTELVEQHMVCRQFMGKNFSGQEVCLEAVKDYVVGSSKAPFVVYGPSGCGKTHFFVNCVDKSSSWLPSAPVVARLAGVTAESLTPQHLLRSILEQCCVLYGEHPAVASESVQDWNSGLNRLFAKVSEARPLIVMIDGLDEIASYSASKEFEWIPNELPSFVKLVVTAREGSDELRRIQGLLKDDNCYLKLSDVNHADEMADIVKMTESKKRRLNQMQKDMLQTCLQEEPNVRYSQFLGYMASRWMSSQQPTDIVLEKSTDGIMMQHLSQAESLLNTKLLTFVLGILVSVKQGICDSEMVDLLSCEEQILDYYLSDTDHRIRRFPDVLWIFSKKLLCPFISSQTQAGRTLYRLSGSAFRTVVMKYLNEKDHPLKFSTKSLVDYFFGKWADGEKKPVSSDSNEELSKERHVLNQPLAYGRNPNRRKLDELPYQLLQLEESVSENFLFDSTWLLYKFCGSDPYHLMEDIACVAAKTSSSDPELDLLASFVKIASYNLRCDGSQFYSQFYDRMRTFFTKCDSDSYPRMKSLYDTSCKPPISSLLSISPCLKEPRASDQLVNCNESQLSPTESCDSFSGLYTIKGDNAHIISLSCERGEIMVWNIYEQKAVRKLTGINQPKDIKMIDNFRALVLCNRELRVYHLDQGTLLVKLKGVMNQKMAYYGLHDENYAVALSRNRMYVNMTNLTTGDLETTFKVGEDRFLNSLLVSANGKICVCGDETQKPFPLLVWDLASRKLVYDLRIPHHEFVTRLSAISDDGHYVVSVCRELHDTSSNFIIVYDLQSGTLFKKWKPESKSCSIGISSQGGCVINGLDNTWVLIWDLSTGARRYTLRGHSAPADQIRLEEDGNRCLTYDSNGMDRSIRVWDVAKGECLAVFTPDQSFSCCELSLEGQAVILGLKGSNSITTLLLCKDRSVDDSVPEITCYGDEGKKHQVFDLSGDGQ